MSVNRFAALFSLALLATPVVSQQRDAVALAPQESRASLIAAASEADAQAARESNRDKREALQAKAQHIRVRLEQGDAQVGDKVIIDVVSPPEMASIADTFDVRADQMLQLTGIKGEIPLRGVLRSELADHITKYLAKDYKTPQIRTQTMIGIFITGEVTAPGSRPVTQDALLRDVVTGAGKILPSADYNKITVRRQDKLLISADTMRAALSDGRTVGEMQLLSGDEIEVGLKRRTNWFNVVQFATYVFGLGLAIYGVAK